MSSVSVSHPCQLLTVEMCNCLIVQLCNLQVPHLIGRIPRTSTIADRIIFAQRTPELAFIDSNVHDDARQGIAAMSAMEARATIMVSMLSELRILFGLNVGFAFFVLYYATFLRTISNVVQQVLQLQRAAVHRHLCRCSPF